MLRLSLAIAPLMLVACQSTTADEPPATPPPAGAEATPSQPPADGTPPDAMAMCNADAVQKHVGHGFTDAMGERLRTEAGARTVRVIRPGQAVTMDYRTDRLNVELDSSDRIAALRCG